MVGKTLEDISTQTGHFLVESPGDGDGDSLRLRVSTQRVEAALYQVPVTVRHLRPLQGGGGQDLESLPPGPLPPLTLIGRDNLRYCVLIGGTFLSILAYWLVVSYSVVWHNLTSRGTKLS